MTIIEIGFGLFLIISIGLIVYVIICIVKDYFKNLIRRKK